VYTVVSRVQYSEVQVKTGGPPVRGTIILFENTAHYNHSHTRRSRTGDVPYSYALRNKLRPGGEWVCATTMRSGPACLQCNKSYRHIPKTHARVPSHKQATQHQAIARPSTTEGGIHYLSYPYQGLTRAAGTRRASIEARLRRDLSLYVFCPG
jgi:hypothetical protein